MKKNIKYWLPLALVFGFVFTSCTENDPKIEDFESDKVAFVYGVDGDEFKLDYFYGSTIAFDNRSAAQGACTWVFGDGGTSNERSPQHIYELPGLYDVTLTIEGEGKKTGKIMISDIVPLASYTSSDPIPVNKLSKIMLSVFVPNPADLEIEYTWKFPAGTVDENGNVITQSNLADPGTLTFNNVGSQQIKLTTVLGGRDLDEKTLNVNIGYSEPSKTIYYAVKGGNMMALKLIDNLPPDVKNLPLDLGIKSGQHPFNMFFNQADSSIYVLDAGSQYYFTNDPDRILGDGRIAVISKDGKTMEEVVSNKGGFAFDDPFFGTIEGGRLYYSDRNTGVSITDLTSRNQGGDRLGTYWIQNNYLGYFDKGYGYGAISSSIAKYDNMWWWGKIYGGSGIFRFVEGDIHTNGTGKEKPVPASGIILSGELPKSFAFDKKNDAFYVAVIDKGLYTHPLSALSPTVALKDMTRIAELPTDTEGTASERIYICQMVLDEDNGNLYFAYRAPSTGTILSGLKYYNSKTKKLESLLNDVEAYSVTINNQLSKLF